MDSRAVQDELERRAYHLRTLYDVSKELFASVHVETIVKNFLFMTMGSFGVSGGFVLIRNEDAEGPGHFVSKGFAETGHEFLKDKAAELLRAETLQGADGPPAVEADPERLPPGVACLVRFRPDSNDLGLLALGKKLTEEPFTSDDEELLITLVNHLVVALRNAESFQNTQRLNRELTEKNERLESVLNELDRRVYHLKTLYDVSKDIFASVDSEAILRNFLLMTMGNFGVLDGFALTLELPSASCRHFVCMGRFESRDGTLRDRARELLLDLRGKETMANGVVLTHCQDSLRGVACAMPFEVDSGCLGLLGMGPKLIGEDYHEEDKELLATLLNNLVVALKNARSFEEIKQLNQDLQEKNVALEKALRKVELLESIKANLSKFVPTTVTRLIEKFPEAEIPEAGEQDVSVLFLDIEGYTKLSERLGTTELNELIEKYFSVFMEAIHENNGDVNETAGDGLMVLFLNQDPATNALEAVRTALTIRERAASISREENGLSEPLVVNMGINSGPALVGAARFESYTGSRWTYTARGMVTNVAARIGALATHGAIHLSRSTADRVRGQVPLTALGEFSLKNVSEPVEIFRVE